MRHTAAFALLALLASGCASTRSTATHADGPFSGPWLMTVRPVIDLGIGDVRTVVYADPDGAAFEAHSRPGAVRDLVGGGTALLASVAGGEAVRGGALVHVYDGRAATQGDSVAVSGRLVTRGFRSTLMLSGGIRNGRMTGVLRGQNTGTLVATVEAVPFTGALPIEDYAALVPQMRAVVAERYFDPRGLDTEAFRDFWAVATARLGRAQDDLEANAQFGLATQGLGVSHFRLVRASTALADDGVPTLEAGVSFARRPDGVAVLTCHGFDARQAVPVIDAAFADMAATSAEALVIDLRACPGGDFSSMRIASHLVTAPADAGIFVSNAWWRGHDALPAQAAWSGLPLLSAPDLETFYREVAATGALRTRLEPVGPHYAGPVFVLTSGRTASAAEPLAHFLKSTGRATLVGETTAGAMLASEHVPFGDGWELVVPVADYVAADGARLEAVGVAPDVAVAPTEALERALAMPR